MLARHHHHPNVYTEKVSPRGVQHVVSRKPNPGGFWRCVATPVGMRVLVARFFRHMISENVQVFWAALQRGEFITDAAEAVGTYRKQGARWVAASGGVRPRRGREPAGALPVFR